MKHAGTIDAAPKRKRNPVPDTPSKSAVRKAGSTVRKAHRNEPVTTEQLQHAHTIIEQYRAAHQLPLNRISASLRQLVANEQIPAAVSQRIKRFPTIIDKLTRGGQSGVDDLSRMTDIGGCRIVTETRTDLYKLQQRLLELWGPDTHSPNKITKIRDYIARPKDTGYRAIHLQVERDGLKFEVQLRDPRLHAWAETVEAFSGDLGVNYKQGGHSVVQEFMKLLSEFDALDEAGRKPSQDQLDTMHRLYSEVQGLYP